MVDSPQVRAPLRFGLMVTGTTARAWQAAVVRSLLDVPGVEPAVLVVDARTRPNRSARDRWDRLRGSQTRLWDLYNNGWVARRSAALRPVDLSVELGGLPRVEVEVRKEGYSEYFPDDALAEIRRHDLDFVLRFAFGIIRGEILDAPRLGVWSFHHGDEEHYRGSPPAFWELVEGRAVTGAVLQRLTDRLDGGRILHKGWFRTARHSYVRNTDTVHFGCVDWPARVCRAVLAGHGEAADGVLSRSTAPVYRKPRDVQTTRFLAGQAGRFVVDQAHALSRADQWEVGLVGAPIHRFLEADFQPSVTWLGLSDARAYAADPFFVPHRDGSRILYERYHHRRRVGEIFEVDPDGQGPAPAGIPVEGHASYPFVFEADGHLYCLPQVHDRALCLYERRGGCWVEEAVLLADTPLLDPTVVRHEDRWWLFGTRPGSFSLTQLHVWWADDLAGPWQEHVLNPVKTDVRSARPAGTPFVHDGRLYRPAQDCSAGYGGAVTLCEVVRLDLAHFEEQVVRSVEADPSWPFDGGLHTISGYGDRTLIDARRRVFERHEAMAELRARLGRRSE